MTHPTGQPVVIGTRGSDLALTQTRDVIRRLAALGHALEIHEKIIQTTGDRRRDVPLAELGRTADNGAPVKGVFIKELEEALTAGEIDAAVHSLKDLPSELLPAFQLAAILPRAPVEDVLVTRAPLPTSTTPGQGPIHLLPASAVVATGSVRRTCELLRLRPDLDCRDLRGNVPTRLKKLAEPDGPDAIVLAHAGLHRLGIIDVTGRPDPARLAGFGLPQLHFHLIPTDHMLPAAGQGAVAVECRSNDGRTRALLEALNDPDTATCVAAERAFLAALGAGCDTPVGAHATLINNQGVQRLVMRCRLFEQHDNTWTLREVTAEASAIDPATAAASALQLMKEAAPMELSS